MKINNINTAASCPISLKQVDKNLIKLYSGFVVSLLILSLFIPCKIGIYLITIDFFIRVFIGIKYSPLCNIATKSLKIVAVKPILIDSGRKKIAAQVGFAFSVGISFAFLLGYDLISTLLTSMFIFAILIDLIFDYCLACKMQSLYFKLKGD